MMRQSKERLPDAFAIRERYALPLILNRDAGIIAIERRRHPYGSSFPPVLHSVVEEVEKHLPHGLRIDVRPQPLVDRRLQCHARRADEGSEYLGRFANQRAKGDGVRMDLGFSAAARESKKVLHEHRQPTRLFRDDLRCPPSFLRRREFLEPKQVGEKHDLRKWRPQFV